MANYIGDKTGGEVTELIPATPYPTEYNATTEVALAERDGNARPAIKDPMPEEVMSGYDVIFVGYPIWWRTAPMIIGTFLESYDLTGKHIYSFSQYCRFGRHAPRL